jgi:hypothetical protein
MTRSLSDAISDVRIALLNLDNAIQAEMAENDDATDVCTSLFEIHALKSEISIVYDMACSVASKAMKDAPEISLPNGARVEKKVASTRKGWKHKDLGSAVAGRIVQSAVDMDTGEVTLSTEEMIMAMLNYVQPSYWRIKELSAIGINADNYCEVDEPKTSIIVRKGTSGD